ncbi:hypothetical protein J2S30_003596 [Herbaspirillum rubrisubalbicans]|uniref:hypothetical protein n=1 Tax=Herbaspirillum rubrisubalbicans TaxID=80842 RepID=UPI00209DA438|nr:hypothetical protein [Herbaspirillum rubrisubalbicans]MCP1575217.1 hypothetical protein [Herbaspirillum rubrisubalbicans]
MIDIQRMDGIKEVFHDLSVVSQQLRTKKMDENNGDDGPVSFLNYDYSLAEKVKNEMKSLIFYFEVQRRALKEKDHLAAIFALIRSGDLAQKLADIFGGIEETVHKVMYRDPNFSWPSVPEGYQIPQQLLMAGADTLKYMADRADAANCDVLMVWENAVGKIEVMEKNSVDVIRKSFIELAASIGISKEEMNRGMDENDQFEWCIDYAHSLGDTLEKYLDKLLLFFEVHRIAVQRNDQLAAYIALMDAGIYAQLASDFFLTIKDEVDNVAVLNKRFSWPSVPDGYKLPEHFGITSHG